MMERKEKEVGEQVEIEIPPDAKTVTLALNRDGKACMTLRQLLPTIKCPVRLKIVEEGERRSSSVFVDELNGGIVLSNLEATGLVDGKSILELEPEIFIDEPIPTITDGSVVTSKASRVLVRVKIHRDDK